MNLCPLMNKHLEHAVVLLKKTEGLRINVIYQTLLHAEQRGAIKGYAGVYRHINRNHFLFLQWISLG